jgi:hypothetical protein
VAVAIANITLSGEQTVNGVAAVAGDRVLVTAQTSAVDNGVYDVSSSAWARSADWDGNRDVINGTLVVVAGNPVAIYQMTGTNPITIGTSSLTFTVLTELGLTALLASILTGEGASKVGFEDAAGDYAAADVEAALVELAPGGLLSYGSFTPTFSGFSADPSAPTLYWSIQGNIVTITCDWTTGTSDQIFYKITNIPTNLRTAIGNSQSVVLAGIVDNGVTSWGNVIIAANNAEWDFGFEAPNANFAASGTKGMTASSGAQITFQYTLRRVSP